MTLDELRAWYECPPTKTPQALAVAEAVGDLFKAFDAQAAQLRKHAREFVPLAEANERLKIAEAAIPAYECELARLRALVLPAAPWEELEWNI